MCSFRWKHRETASDYGGGGGVHSRLIQKHDARNKNTRLMQSIYVIYVNSFPTNKPPPNFRVGSHPQLMTNKKLVNHLVISSLHNPHVGLAKLLCGMPWRQASAPLSQYIADSGRATTRGSPSRQYTALVMATVTTTTIMT